MKSRAGRKQKHVRPSVELITKALNQAAQDAVEIHRQAGQPVVVWQDGRTVLVPADEIATRGRIKRPKRRKSRDPQKRSDAKSQGNRP